MASTLALSKTLMSSFSPFASFSKLNPSKEGVQGDDHVQRSGSLGIRKVRLLSEKMFKSNELRLFTLSYCSETTPVFLLVDDNLVNSKSLMAIVEQES